MRFCLNWSSILIVLSFCCVIPLESLANADTPATQPADDGPPVPAALAPSYLAIGQTLSMQLDLFKRAIADLKLDDAVRRQANAMVDQSRAEINSLIQQMKSGNMPSNARVTAIPENLRSGRAKLFDLIGPEQTRLLQEELQSMRGQGRQKIGELRSMLTDLTLTTTQKQQCDACMVDADSAVEKLSAHDLQGDEYDKSHAQMSQIFATIHDRLATVLSEAQKQELGPRFAQLSRPATGPSAKSAVQFLN
jgi:hypothetical protein